MTRARARISARAIIAPGMCAIKFPAKAINCGRFLGSNIARDSISMNFWSKL